MATESYSRKQMTTLFSCCLGIGAVSCWGCSQTSTRPPTGQPVTTTQESIEKKAEGTWPATQPSRLLSFLAKKVAQADAIVVGRVAEIEPKRYLVTLFKKGSDGTLPARTTYYNLAVLHPENVLKTDSGSIVNKADKSNPVDWMHVAYRAPEQGIRCFDPLSPPPCTGDRCIWFLCRDRCMTGHYFIKSKQIVTDATLQQIKRLVGDKNARSR